MLCYGMRWDSMRFELKRPHTYNRSKQFEETKKETKVYHKSAMWTFILLNKKPFKTELKSCCMLCYGMIWKSMKLYAIVWYSMLLDFNAMLCYTMVCVVKGMLEPTVPGPPTKGIRLHIIKNTLLRNFPTTLLFKIFLSSFYLRYK